MNKPIIAIKMHVRNYSGLANLGNSVHEALTGNADFISPAPSLPVLRTAIDNVSASIAKWGPKGNRGSHLDLVELRMHARTLWELLRAMSDYVQSTAQTACGSDYVMMESMISSSGFGLRKTNTPQGVLEKVQNFHQVASRTLNSNQVKLQWEKPLNLNSAHNVKTYGVFRGTTPAFSAAVLVDTVSATSFTETNDTGSVQTWFYWVAPLNYAGYGVVSDSMKVTVLGS